jgi:aspartyl protease family protein
MLKNAVVFAGSALALALLAPAYMPSVFSAGDAPPAAASHPAPHVVAPVQPRAEPAAARQDGSGEKSIPADAGGQYSVEALIGGERVHMLVDTGATMVVISASLADRLGLSVEAGRKWRVHTANGDATATEAVLPSVDLGSVYMKDVHALIADRSAGEVNLLGASFLKRLTSVESRDGVLILRQ